MSTLKKLLNLYHLTRYRVKGLLAFAADKPTHTVAEYVHQMKPIQTELVGLKNTIAWGASPELLAREEARLMHISKRFDAITQEIFIRESVHSARGGFQAALDTMDTLTSALHFRERMCALNDMITYVTKMGARMRTIAAYLDAAAALGIAPPPSYREQLKVLAHSLEANVERVRSLGSEVAFGEWAFSNEGTYQLETYYYQIDTAWGQIAALSDEVMSATEALSPSIEVTEALRQAQGPLRTPFVDDV